jgi:hypothetical protein
VLTSFCANLELREHSCPSPFFAFRHPCSSYADIMLAEAVHMLLIRVGPSPFQAFPRLLALYSHITRMPAIAR